MKIKERLEKNDAYWKNRVKNELSAQEFHLTNKHKEEKEKARKELIQKFICWKHLYKSGSNLDITTNEATSLINEVLGAKK